MRVFVTGASGWIGSAVVPELLSAGHQVLALARSEEAAAALATTGAQVHRGDLTDPDALAAAAAGADGTIHLAFRHDLSFTGQMQAAVDADLAAITAIAAAYTGTDKPLVVTSGVAGLRTDGTTATEADRGTGGRRDSEDAAFAAAGRGVRASVVRPAPTVHGARDSGFVAVLTAIAREKGAAGYVGDGAARWPAVHRSDAARLYRLALESAPAGSVLHAVAEQGVATRDIAAAIGRSVGVPAVSVDPADAQAHFGWIGGFFGLDMPAASDETRHLLGWEPTGPGLIADLDDGAYAHA